MRFDEFDLSYDLLDALDAMNFTDCTPIQEKAIDVVLSDRDLIGVAQTGTGKTAAYLLPVLSRLDDMERSTDAIRCIVMVPTHELARQIDCRLEGFSYYLPVSSLAIHGGNDGPEFARQQRGLRTGADIVIATPGRLLAHLKMGKIDLSKVKWFILDEADRMLDMGFYEDIMQIVRQLPVERQTLLFSATMPDKIQKLSQSILRNPVEVKIAVSRPTEKINQSAVVCFEKCKTNILCDIFASGTNKKVIVFASSKQKVKDLTRTLSARGWKAAEMHSDLSQHQREETMHLFAAAKTDILVATDILARGIDIDDIAMVVNFDVPREAEDYVHRIGRTARANAEGRAVTFVSEHEQDKFGRIERFLGYEVTKESVHERHGEQPPYNPRIGKGSSHRKNYSKRKSFTHGKSSPSQTAGKEKSSHSRNRNNPKSKNQDNRPSRSSTQNQHRSKGGGTPPPKSA